MLENLLRHYGYLVVYFGTLLEPDATLVASTFLAHRGYFRVGVVWFIATLATISMSQFWFWLARHRGRELLDRMAATNSRYAKVRGWVERNGDILVFFSRFLWGLRLAIASACGATGVRPIRFALVDTAGAILWTGIVGTVGYAIAHAIGTFFQQIRKYEDVIALGLLGVVTFVVMFRRHDARTEVAALRNPSQLGVEALGHVDRRIIPKEKPEQIGDSIRVDAS